ncbi:MAG: ABC transporter permease subunit [Ilumatobacteraceae bacterium]
MSPHIPLVLLAALSLALAASACGDDDPAKSDASGDITVFAAASLSGAYEEIAALYERQHDGASVELNFAASSELAVQITEGRTLTCSPPPTNPTWKRSSTRSRASRASSPRTRSRSSPSPATRRASKASPISRELIVVSCGPDVPIGAYTRQVFEDAGVEVEIDSEEADVTAVANKVVLGEADAGIVYATDAVAAGDAASSIAIPADLNVVAEYLDRRTRRQRRSVPRSRARRRGSGDPRRVRLHFTDVFVVRRAVLRCVPGPGRARRGARPTAARRRRHGGRGGRLLHASFAGVLWRLPWSDAWSILSDPEVLTALRLSVMCSTVAAIASLVFGLPLAWLLATIDFPGRRVVRPVRALDGAAPSGRRCRTAVRARTAWSPRRSARRHLRHHAPYTTTAVIIAQTFVAMPFLVLTVEGALRQHDHRDAEAARTLGASRWYALRRVTLPAIRPAVVAGMVLAWARALGEFGATITFAGNSSGRTRTLPMKAYLSLQSDPPEALVISLVLIAVSFVVLIALRDRWLGNGLGSAVRAANERALRANHCCGACAAAERLVHRPSSLSIVHGRCTDERASRHRCQFRRVPPRRPTRRRTGRGRRHARAERCREVNVAASRCRPRATRNRHRRRRR